MKDDKRHTRERRLTKAESRLWRDYTRDVTLSPGAVYVEPDEAESPPPPPPRPHTIETIPDLAPAPRAHVSQPPGMPQTDRRTADRLKRGRLPIEARLDLHGMTQDTAYDALARFIRDCHGRGLRCVLIITGKGRKDPDSDRMQIDPGPGILRQRVPEWLYEAPLSGLILRHEQARIPHGGAGAIYVLLRRRRGPD